MAIVNYTKICPLYKIPHEEVELAKKLIFRDESAGDPLQVYMAHFAGMKGEGANEKLLEQLLEDALASYSPLELINTVLLDGMKTVGDHFGARKMRCLPYWIPPES